MSKHAPLFGIIVVLCIIMASCNTGPGDDEIAASVEAQLAVAQTQTAEAAQPLAAEDEQEDLSITESDEGWQVYKSNEFGFQVALPPGWTQLDLTADDFYDVLSAASESNPELGSFFSSEYVSNLVVMGIKLIALDTSPESLASGMATNFNILVIEMPMDIAFDDYIEANVLQLEGMFGEEVTITEDVVFLGDLKAGKLEYTTELNDAMGRPQNVAYQQHLILDGRTQYVLTFTSLEAQAEKNEVIFTDIVQSFELVK